MTEKGFFVAQKISGATWKISGVTEKGFRVAWKTFLVTKKGLSVAWKVSEIELTVVSTTALAGGIGFAQKVPLAAETIRNRER